MRPRGGLLRSREFLMKDLYTFDHSAAATKNTYDEISEAYLRIFSRIGIPISPVAADSGAIGGSLSHEYHLRVPAGEDTLITCHTCNHTCNREIATAVSPDVNQQGSGEWDVCWFKRTGASDDTSQSEICCGLIPAGEQFNSHLLKREIGGEFVQIKSPASKNQVKQIFIDSSTGIHQIHAWGDLPTSVHSSLPTSEINIDQIVIREGNYRLAKSQDLCTECGSHLEESRGLELGHTFMLGAKYSKAMGLRNRKRKHSCSCSDGLLWPGGDANLSGDCRV